MAFSDNLQYLRKKNKITQEELADEINVTRQSVSKWETGEAFPDTDKLILLCEKFNMTMDKLVRGNVAADDNANNETCILQDGNGLNCCGEEENIKNSACTTQKKVVLCTAINVTVMLCALVVFLTCGFVWNLWYISWVAFVYACGLSSGIDGVVIYVCYNGKCRKLIWRELAGSLSGFVMLNCTAVYLTIGMAIGMWHPTWVIFVVGAVICAVTDAICGTCTGVNKK